MAQLDLSALYAHYGPRGGEPYAPEVLLGLLLYGYATGVFSSRKIERAMKDACAVGATRVTVAPFSPTSC